MKILKVFNSEILQCGQNEWMNIGYKHYPESPREPTQDNAFIDLIIQI